MKITVITDIHINKTDSEKLESFKSFIKELKADLLLISGDISSSSQEEFELAFRSIREINPTIQVAIVKGNHDFWMEGNSHRSIAEIEAFHDEVLKKYNIHYLQNNKLELDSCVIYGFDGWYRFSHPGTKDEDYMPLNSGFGELTPFQYLQRNELKAVDYILDSIEKETKKKILLTHFNLIANQLYEKMSGNVRLLDILSPHFDIMIYGHSHQLLDTTHNGCRIINVGADYKEAPSLEKYSITLEI